MLFILYQILSILSFPFLILHFFLRVLSGKENISSFFDRIGLQTGFNEGKYIHIHAASIGEIKSGIKMIRSILDLGFNVKITVMTKTAKSIIDEIFTNEKSVKTAYIPYDSAIFVLIFFLLNRPAKIIMIESDLWPNFIFFGKVFCKNIYYVNARISDKSYKSWVFLKDKLGFNVLSRFDKVFSAENGFVEKLQNFNHNVYFFGNIKNDYIPIKTKDMMNFEILYKNIVKKPVFFLANTHEGEESAIVSSVKSMINKDFAVIIAPRHIKRVSGLVNYLRSVDLSPILVSEILDGQRQLDENDILINDKIGIMSSLYDLASFVFTGGSLLDEKIGGHSPLEPFYHKKPVLMGTLSENSKESVAKLKKLGCLFQVNINEISDIVIMLLLNYDKIELIIEKELTNRKFISDTIIKEIFA